MKYPEVKQFCCCCSLETGSKIIAWLQIIIVPLTFLFDLSLGVVVEYSPEAAEEPIYHTILVIYYVQALLALISAVLGFFLAIFLLIGVQRKKPVILDFWVKYETGYIILYTIFFIITSPFLSSYVMGIGPLLNVIFELISIAIDVYCIVVVSSCRKEMSRRRIVRIQQDREIQSTEIQYSGNDLRESPNNVNDPEPPKYEADNKRPDEIPLVENEELLEV